MGLIIFYYIKNAHISYNSSGVLQKTKHTTSHSDNLYQTFLSALWYLFTVCLSIPVNVRLVIKEESVLCATSVSSLNLPNKSDLLILPCNHKREHFDWWLKTFCLKSTELFAKNGGSFIYLFILKSSSQMSWQGAVFHTPRSGGYKAWMPQ